MKTSENRSQPDRRSSPSVPLLFSFVFPGLGQLYNGQILKGLFIIFLSCLSILIVTVASCMILLRIIGFFISAAFFNYSLGILIFGLVLMCAVAVYSFVDSYRVAKSRCSLM